jgi:putative addiction module component (TIGR02574 family)
MSIDVNLLRSLSATEKLQIVEMLWDDLGASSTPIPLPDWMEHEVARRREEMCDPKFGLSHEETWRRITNRNG